ncbi:MAG: NAD(P)/FAD-dependent oxidoreductase [Planctomycetota bacterium]
MAEEQTDIIIVGAGAAGLMTAVCAGRELQGSDARITLVDGSPKVGVKILVAGGGRCNVTHHEIDERQYAGGSRNTIRKVLRQFGVSDTVAFFGRLGVELKREATGKLFPTTDDAHTVLDALLGEIERLGVDLRHPWRIGSAIRDDRGNFVVRRAKSEDVLVAPRLVLATGGKALPRSGSDGAGYRFAEHLGHSITDHVFPSLVPLVSGERSEWVRALSGVSARARVEVRAGSGKRLADFENDLLCTHFGLSGPAVMDASRWLTDARHSDPAASLAIAWLPGETFESVEQTLLRLGNQSVLAWLKGHLPERLAREICAESGVDPATPGTQLPKAPRRTLAHALVGMPIDIERDRGYTHAEVTAGGVPLNEIDPKTMQSRVCDGLWLVGEILDVDGRIGGFNFQWAWATGSIAGASVGGSVSSEA